MINLIQAWAMAHQTLVAVLIWPILSALITFIFRKRSDADFVGLPSFLANVLRFTSAVGVDSPYLLASLAKLFAVVPPAPPSTDPEGVHK